MTRLYFYIFNEQQFAGNRQLTKIKIQSLPKIIYQ